jgi:ABC-2 type transport system ATP-binding protein
MDAAIETTGLGKDYGGGHGLHGLDLTVARGEVFGFAGPNGAGKSTTIRLLMGMLRPTAGSARVLGLDCWDSAVAVKRHVGYVPGELPDWGGLRGGELLGWLGGLRGGVDPGVVSDLCRRLELDLGRRWREYSRGNKQKLALVAAFASQPSVLIMDEPTGGLDPLHQRVFASLVGEARERGATVFLSSHVLSEIEHLCDRVAIVRDGRLVEVASLADLRRVRATVVEASFSGAVPVAAVAAVDGVRDVSVDGRRLRCTVTGSFDGLLAVLGGAGVVTLTSRAPSLEEVFLSFYAGGGRDPESGAVGAVLRGPALRSKEEAVAAIRAPQHGSAHPGREA